jgi:hypothetical protein
VNRGPEQPRIRDRGIRDRAGHRRKESPALAFFLLDYRYSDTWADPAKQFIPKAWTEKSHAKLIQAVFEYNSRYDRCVSRCRSCFPTWCRSAMTLQTACYGQMAVFRELGQLPRSGENGNAA